MTKLICLLVCIIVLPAQVCKAQAAFGAFGGVALNTSTANFEQLEGVVNCNALFTRGTGMGAGAGLFYEHPVVGKASFLLRGVYRQANNTLVASEYTAVAVAGTATDARIDHTIDAAVGILGVQPMVKLSLFSGLSVSAGFEAGYVLHNAFEQRETIESPTDVGVFATGSRVRNEQSGPIPNANKFAMSLLAALNYALPLNASNTIQLVPEVSYHHALTPVAQNLQWSVSSITGSIGIRVVIPERPAAIVPTPQPEPTPQPDPPVANATPPPPVLTTQPIIAPPPVLTASIGATGIDDNGVENPVALLRIEEVASTSVIPLLPYIFFESSSTTLPSKYHQSATDEHAVAIHRGMLYELAQRMAANPDSKLSIKGMTLNNKHVTISNETAMARARAVASYMHTTFGIDTRRLPVASSPLLSANTPSLVDNDGVEEINRVDLSSDDANILAPVRLHDTTRVATPPTLRFRPLVESTEPIVRWQITTSQNGKGLKVFKGLGAQPEFVDWDLAAEPNLMPQVPGVVEVMLEIETVNGSTTAQAALSVDQITLRRKKAEYVADKEVEQFNILLFDIGSAELTTAQQSIIEAEIKPRIRRNSIVTIVGHTDRLGDATANAALSLQRAVNTAKILGVPNAIVRGMGESSLLFDNATPEARCLSRTVSVRIETPTESP